MLLCILWSSNSCEPNTQIGRNPVFLNSLFSTCIPILFLSISYPCIVRILKFKQALTQLLMLQICVKENLVWFVLLLRCCVPPQLSCSNDGTVHHSGAVPLVPFLEASDLLPRLRQSHQHHHHPPRPTQWCWGPQGYAKEVVQSSHHFVSPFLCSSNSCEPNTQVDWNPMFPNALFCMCIPILFLCFSCPCVYRILQF